MADEKEEKQEKEHEKEEKNSEEKWRRDPLGAAIWAGILIWAGLALLAGNLGFLARFERVSAWALIFVGAGLLVFLEVAIRLSVPSYRRPVMGSVIFGIILLAIGLGMVGLDVVWPLVIIGVGVALLLRALVWRQ